MNAKPSPGNDKNGDVRKTVSRAILSMTIVLVFAASNAIAASTVGD